MAIENDIVLIHFEDKPLAFARIEEILPDHKPDWYHVKFLILQVPLHTVTWILRDIYIDGSEFTMNGKKIRIEKIVPPDDDKENDKESKSPQDTEHKKDKKSKIAKVISLADVRKK